MSTRFSWAFPILALFVFVGCDSDSGGDDFTPAATLTISDIPADPVTGVDATGRPIGANAFTFVSLRTGEVLPSADSASTQWDLAFKGSTILVNGGTSGPGNGGALVLEALFQEVMEAPASGYNTDSADGFAIPTGSGNGWYNYNPAANILSPIPGRVLVVRCADGSFAKVRIISYYRGAPETPTAEDTSRYITIEYAHQDDGSRRFE